MIDDQTIESIKSAVNIVEVVSDFVPLRRSGTGYKCLCPFHNEKTPSFYVTPSKGIFKCFSCGIAGDAIRFVMLKESFTYPEALRWLAKKYGIAVEEKLATPEELQRRNFRESLFVLNNYAATYFQDTLYNSTDGQTYGLTYLRSRGFRDDIIKKFQLGYSPEGRDVFGQLATKKGYSREGLLHTGLCYETDRGELRDRFHGRVIFPVQKMDGRIVAFGGRVLSNDKKLAKYVNSPESDIYSKRSELYGLYLAKEAIRKAECCYLVEGYTDVISMHQCGIENVVASSGTSLTNEQIRLVQRFTNNLTVLYDGDSAGVKAALRGIDMLLERGMNIKVLLLPDGDDPDSFARKHTASDYVDYINAHQVDFIRFKTNILMSETKGDPHRHGAAVASILKSIAVIPDILVRSYYIKECATLVGLDEQTLLIKLREIREELLKERRRQAEQASPDDVKQPSADTPAASETTSTAPTPQPTEPTREVNRLIHAREKAIIQALIRYGERVMGTMEDDNGNELPISVISFIKQELEADQIAFEDPLFQRIYNLCLDHEHADGFVASNFFAHHEDVDIMQLAATLLSDKYQLHETSLTNTRISPDVLDLNHAVPLLVTDLKWAIVETRMQEIMAAFKDPSLSPDALNQLMQEHNELSAIRQQLREMLKS